MPYIEQRKVGKSMEPKTLKICLMKDLPAILERDVNTLYMTYDKLLLFFGQNQYYDPYVICEEMPENPIAGCLYILFDGIVKAYIGDDIITVAEIEEGGDASKLKLLGTTYFIHADKRYLDLQRRTLQLPYHNGTYSMTVSLAKDLKINDNTVVRYDANTERFYIDGDHDAPPRFNGYKGKETGSVRLEINNHCIHANIKISQAERNLIQIKAGGLYANVDNKISISQFEALLEEYEKYKSETDAVMEALSTIIDNNEALVTDDSIYKMLVDALEEYDENIKEMIDYYSTLTDKLRTIEAESKEYTDKVFAEKTKYLESIITESISSIWGEF